MSKRTGSYPEIISAEKLNSDWKQIKLHYLEVAKKNMPYTGVPKDCIIKATWKKSAKTD